MTLKDHITDWVDVIRWAPSADNGQPWTVRWDALNEGSIQFHLETTGTHRSSRELDRALNEIALGCLAQNLISIARSEGYTPESIVRAPRGFSVTLTKSIDPDPIPWAQWIRQRHTRRCVFRKEPLSEEEVGAINQIVNRYSGLNLTVFLPDLSPIAKLVSRLDVIRYQNDEHNSHFMNSLRFSAEDNDSGLEIDGLEIPWIGKATIRTMARFPVTRLLFWTGLEHIFAFLGCAQLIRRSSAFIHIAAKTFDEWAWFNVGRCLQEVWLEATQRGIAVHPFGHPFIAWEARVNPDAFSPRHQKIVNDVYERFLERGANICQPGIFLRLGYPTTEAPPRTKRRPSSGLILP